LNIRQTLETSIRILTSPLKSEEEMIPILRKRLTKKEYKYLQMISQESTMEEICEKLSLTPEEIESLKEKLIKKLNQEKLKQELMR